MSEETQSKPIAVELPKDEMGRLKENKTLSFRVPDGFPDQGKKIPKPFDYVVCLNDQQAVATIKERKWKLVDIINDKIQSAARSNAYQASLAAYQTLKVSPEAIRVRMIKDMIRSKIPESLATKLVDDALAQAQTT